MTKSLNISSEEFRAAGHYLVDRIAVFLDDLPTNKVSPDINPSKAKELLAHISLNQEGADLQTILSESSDLLFDHSLFNGHPRFWGYITSSATPVGALADLLASSINANVGAFALSPIATEIEKQTIDWLSQLIGYGSPCGGTFVSGGNMANFSGFLAARTAFLPDIRNLGLREAISAYDGTNHKPDLITYCARGTHTWIQKAVDLFGHGTNSIRWIETDTSGKIDLAHLVQQLNKDKFQGNIPFIIIANAGSVSTGIVDDMEQLHYICKSYRIWLHVDGAYGALAAMLPELGETFKGLHHADSVALDPHKWLYSPIEAGCILVRDKNNLRKAFGFNPEYYNFGGEAEETPLNYHEYGMQNSRGFKALKVWLSLRFTGKNGIMAMIRKDIELSEYLFHLVDKTNELQKFTRNLSITTFRYVPGGLSQSDNDAYLNNLNEQLLTQLQKGGEVYLSNAVINGKYCLRVCVVNFRTTQNDLEALVQIVLREGNKIHRRLSETLTQIAK